MYNDVSSYRSDLRYIWGIHSRYVCIHTNWFVNIFCGLSNIPGWQSSTLNDRISIIAYVRFLNVGPVHEIQLQPISNSHYQFWYFDLSLIPLKRRKWTQKKTLFVMQCRAVARSENPEGRGAHSTVVGMICPPGWDRVNCLAQKPGGGVALWG